MAYKRIRPKCGLCDKVIMPAFSYITSASVEVRRLYAVGASIFLGPTAHPNVIDELLTQLVVLSSSDLTRHRIRWLRKLIFFSGRAECKGFSL